MQMETTFQAVLGQVIAQLREEHRRDQAWLADHVGITRSAWSKVENGKTGIPAAVLIKVGEALKIPASEILARAEGVAKRLEKEGVKVYRDAASAKKSGGAGLGVVALLGAAVLGGVVGKMLADADKEKPDKKSG